MYMYLFDLRMDNLFLPNVHSCTFPQVFSLKLLSVYVLRERKNDIELKRGKQREFAPSSTLPPVPFVVCVAINYVGRM